MFRKFTTVNFVLVAAIAATPFLFSACGSKPEDENQELKDFEVTKDTIKSEVRVNFDMLRVNIPTPKVLTQRLTASKINYNKGFLLSSGKAGSFSSNYQKAVGLGAMGADLSVAAAYNQSSDAVEYLTQIGKLAGDLGIGNAFDPEFCKDLLKNVSKPDTFQIMLDKAFDKAERNLRSNQRVATAVMMLTGGWIESMYVSVEGLNTSPNAPYSGKIYGDITAHCAAFDYVFQLLDAYKSNADCAKLAADLEPFKATLLSLGKNGKLGVGDLPKIRETTTALRSKIIG